MTCIVCKNGAMEPATTTFSIDNGKAIVVIRQVPAEICTTCGEEYIDGPTIKEIEKIIAAARKVGLDITVQQFKAA